MLFSFLPQWPEYRGFSPSPGGEPYEAAAGTGRGGGPAPVHGRRGWTHDPCTPFLHAPPPWPGDIKEWGEMTDHDVMQYIAVLL